MTRDDPEREAERANDGADRTTPDPIGDGDHSESQLFRGFPDPLLHYETEGETAVVRGVNPAFERTFGVDGSTAAGAPVADYLFAGAVEPRPTSDVATPEPERDDTERADETPDAGSVLSRLDDGERTTVATRRGADGEQYYYRIRAAQLPDASGGGCIVYTEVTDYHRRVNDLDARVERLERLIDVAAHDLRNPLDVAKIRVEAARDTSETVHFEKAEAALDRIRRIVRDVLSVGTADPDPTEGTAIVTVAEAAWSTVDTDAAVLVAEDDLPTVEADGDLLRHLFENLFRNAVEHGSTSNQPGADDVPRMESDAAHQNPSDSEDAVEHGSAAEQSPADAAAERGSGGDRPPSGDAVERGGDVTVTVGRLPDGFFVADDGRGIPPAEREKVFAPGYSTADDNTGLGLAIVEQIAEAHGWRVELTAPDSGGARFEFTGLEPDDRA